MTWEFWRIEWPTAAVVVALALVPVWLLFAHPNGLSQQTSTELVDEPTPALAMTDTGPYPQEQQVGE
jgi:hypothetical protein